MSLMSCIRRQWGSIFGGCKSAGCGNGDGYESMH